ncbi:hypothetical protein [Pseudomonas donghuensis]|uniref:hypothetical protein n=1 Tax=Pseudomonas donghuensis TaxID=1163398 RepID=UPI00215EAE2E|nr:hypothetical protein [Pseudomonas donghuensis]UVL23718.1 hypothetical protein LOY30_23360 [Pseudomonas donghuensis]
MMTDKSIWLEVRKDNGAILSYFLERPGTPSAAVDYVQATHAELTYLNGLEDAILPDGMVVTLSDLEAHRTRVQVAQKAKTSGPTRAAPTAPKKPPQSASKAGTTQSSTEKQRAKASFIAALKQHRSNKQ